jgi:hypothetical protein
MYFFLAINQKNVKATWGTYGKEEDIINWLNN